MSLTIKRIIFWGLFISGTYLIGKPYRESGSEIGFGFVFSIIGLFTVLYFLSKKIFKKEME